MGGWVGDKYEKDQSLMGSNLRDCDNQQEGGKKGCKQRVKGRIELINSRQRRGRGWLLALSLLNLCFLVSHTHFNSTQPYAHSLEAKPHLYSTHVHPILHPFLNSEIG